MGDMSEQDSARADLVLDNLSDAMGKFANGFTGVGQLDPGFDVPDEFDTSTEPANSGLPPRNDPARPEARRGRYTLPNPDNGKSKSWQRVTTFVKMTDDTYHLELWKQRNVAKGVAILAQSRPGFIDDLATRDVKVDKDRLNKIVERAQDEADAYKMADEGTALHTSTELADYNGGKLDRVPERHHARVQMYLDALRVNGLRVVPDMIERVTASARFEVAGKFDRIFRLADGSYVIGDLKTGDSLDLSMPSIAAQLDCYRDGINNVGVFDGQRYDTSIRVRNDFGIVVHLPSTRDECTVYRIDLNEGRRINEANLTVRNARKIKAKHVANVFDPSPFAPLAGLEADAYWLEQLNAAHTYAELTDVAARARNFGQWNERLAAQARVIAAGIMAAEIGA